ncbi:MAG TPA: protoglobin domain-containing protein [Caulobacteraceae bacterium]|jgi:rsbT co-antagonist protein RsbR|nr:protoglobin domain-containing protein [Caulobacteraceae bacterium]
MAQGQPSAPIGFGQLAAEDLERRLRFVGFSAEDHTRIEAVKDDVLDHLDQHLGAFFDHLARFEGAQGLFRRADLLDEARRLKREHLIAMVQGEYGMTYVEQRFALGQLYNRAQLEISLFMGAFHNLMASIGARIMDRFPGDGPAGFAHFTSFKKVGFFDLAIIVDAMMADREQTIRRQQEAIRELSTPTLQVRDRLLILPIIGLLDTHRAKQLTDGLLQAIRAHRAKVVVVDMTGVATVDSKVANHLIQTVEAARLMGASAIVTGLSADVAQSLVTLGVDLSRLNTMGDLQGGIEEAERILGYAPRNEQRSHGQAG